MTPVLNNFQSLFSKFLLLFFLFLVIFDCIQSFPDKIFLEGLEQIWVVLVDGFFNLLSIVQFHGLYRVLTHRRLGGWLLAVLGFVIYYFFGVEDFWVTPKQLLFELISFILLLSNIRVLGLFGWVFSVRRLHDQNVIESGDPDLLWFHRLDVILHLDSIDLLILLVGEDYFAELVVLEWTRPRDAATSFVEWDGLSQFWVDGAIVVVCTGQRSNLRLQPLTLNFLHASFEVDARRPVTHRFNLWLMKFVANYTLVDYACTRLSLWVVDRLL